MRGVSSGSSYIAVTAYPSVYFIFVISESENDMYRSCIRSKFPIRGKIELQFANHELHEKYIIQYIYIYVYVYNIIYRYDIDVPPLTPRRNISHGATSKDSI